MTRLRQTAQRDLFELNRPFIDLAALPTDVFEAHEEFKLAIIRHRCGGWTEITRGDLVEALRSLIDFTNR